ncbi:hypothetical protein GCM10007887_01420 [Methylobacterium haplocladii]|nr:hypothetical protein GCM10007887_01420 [Methylobacterium haplocladii]
MKSAIGPLSSGFARASGAAPRQSIAAMAAGAMVWRKVMPNLLLVGPVRRAASSGQSASTKGLAAELGRKGGAAVRFRQQQGETDIGLGSPPATASLRVEDDWFPANRLRQDDRMSRSIASEDKSPQCPLP